MANLGSILLEKDILLESGTNEVEILVFRVHNFRLGINVAKVREVLSYQHVTRLPNSHPSIVGCFQLRDVVAPCVSLHQHLAGVAGDPEQCKVILTEFNGFQTAFLVDEVERIHRISWENVLPAPEVVTRASAPVTALTTIDGKLVTILDFETIVAQVSESTGYDGVVENHRGVDRGSQRVIVADDSPTVRTAVATALTNSGYSKLEIFENGRDAWHWLLTRAKGAASAAEVASLVISDIEMPSMDGMHLTRNIKEHPLLRAIPVVLFSSILTPENKRKGQTVGADAQITKPELIKVVDLADDLIFGPDNAPSASTRAGATRE
ncbi:MAG: chemotaxis protein CheV, partial [Planctomycetales bacterium]|nr:chemotaxis protein CheV [Planctomycetales bacterium]